MVANKVPTERNSTNRFRWDAVDQKNATGLLLVCAVAVLCGVVQLLAQGNDSVFLSLGLLLLAAYMALVLAQDLAVLAVLLAVFVELWGLAPESIQVGPLKLIDIVTVIALLPLVTRWMKTGFPFHGSASRRLLVATLILSVIIVGEILVTTFSTGQDIWKSIKAGKPFLYYFGFLLVPIYAGTPRRVQRLAGLMTGVASGLAIVYLMVSLTGESHLFPALVTGETNFIGIGRFTRVRSYGAPLIVVMFLYQFYRFAANKASRLEKVALCTLAIGTVVHFYRSVWAGIIGGVLVQACVERNRGARNAVKFLIAVSALVLGIGLIHPEYGQMIFSRGASTLTEVEELDGSYGVRHEQIQLWLPLLKQHWITGVGFLHHDSPVGQKMEVLHDLEGTGNYDIGWIDLMGRLGALGCTMLAIALYYLSKTVWSYRSYNCDSDIAVTRRTLAAFLAAGVISLPAYPLLSWGGGVFPLALLVGMLAVLEESAPTLSSVKP